MLDSAFSAAGNHGFGCKPPKAIISSGFGSVPSKSTKIHQNSFKIHQNPLKIHQYPPKSIQNPPKYHFCPSQCHFSLLHRRRSCFRLYLPCGSTLYAASFCPAGGRGSFCPAGGSICAGQCLQRRWKSWLRR